MRDGLLVRCQDVVDTLKKEERAEGRSRKWRGAFRRIQQQLLDLEADSKALELVFPQASQLLLLVLLMGTSSWEVTHGKGVLLPLYMHWACCHVIRGAHC